MDAREWAREVIRLWRERVEPLQVTHQVSNLDDLSAPVQLTLFLSEQPPASLLFVTHSPRVPDGEVQTYGPTRPDSLLSDAEVALEQPLWKTPISTEEIRGRPREPILGTLATDHLKRFFKDLQTRLFMAAPRSSAGIGKTWFAYRGGSVWNSWGLLTDISPAKVVDEMVSRVEPMERALPSSSQSSASAPVEHIYDGFGAHLFPSLLIGEAPRRGIRDEVLGHTSGLYELGHIVIDATLGGRRLLVSHNGFVGIVDTKEGRALRALNSIALALNLAGKTCHPFRTEELGRFDVPRGSTFGWSGWMMPDTFRMSVAHNIDKPAHPAFETGSWVSRDDFTSILQAAERLIASDRADDDMLALEAMAHLAQNEFSPSFLMSWMIVEKRLNSKWRAYLESKHLDEEREDKLLSTGMWSAEIVSEVLSLHGEMSESEYSEFKRLKKVRNNLLHGRQRATRHDAMFALDVATRALGYDDAKARLNLK